MSRWLMILLLAQYAVLAVVCIVEAVRGKRASGPWVLYWIGAACIVASGLWIRRGE